ncbi:hypothetical protein EDEG_03356 [Edhazardia aedis USNM 41457]|uniref:Uncharacterized protein n=1 Tax=Edhazardia aedis (strain USNM 41457) TaxID=1003232 RepID=J9DLG7_EDHAE|nr:hypothetical protein EDEG_03356 [Edhazardia aedis USNM 41457]|eukprot:EJW02202.1 hypothetical protein EDEG_03356 [Edhazardia aedis USNM 41457]
MKTCNPTDKILCLNYCVNKSFSNTRNQCLKNLHYKIPNQAKFNFLVKTKIILMPYNQCLQAKFYVSPRIKYILWYVQSFSSRKRKAGTKFTVFCARKKQEIKKKDILEIGN